MPYFLVDGFNTSSGEGGIHAQVFNSNLERLLAIRLPGVGVKLDAPALSYPAGNFDNTLYAIKTQQTGSHGIELGQYASDNMAIMCIPEYAGGNGWHITAPGNQIVCSHPYNCTGRGVYCNSRQLKLSNMRIQDTNGGIEWVPDSSGGGLNATNITLRCCSTEGDGLHDGIVIAPTAQVRGAVLSGIELNTGFVNGTSNRMRYGINIANANMIGATISGVTSGFEAPATSATLLQDVIDFGTNTMFSGVPGYSIPRILTGSTPYDPPSLVKGTQTTTQVSFPGAEMNDFVNVSFSLNTQGTQFSGSVTSPGFVTVVIENGTGGTVNLGSGTLKVLVIK